MPSPYIAYQDEWTTVICGDIQDVLGKNDFVPLVSMDMAMTSVPYLRQRRYAEDGAYGWEETVKDWLNHMDTFAAKTALVLKPHGTLWFNCGDKWGGSSSSSDYGDKRSNSAPADYEAVKGTKLEIDAINRKGNLMMLPERCVIRWTDAKVFTLINKVVWHKPTRQAQSFTRKLVDTYEPLYFLAKDEQKYRWNRAAVGVEKRGEMDFLQEQPGDSSGDEEGLPEPSFEPTQLFMQMPREVLESKYDADHPPPFGHPLYAMWYAATRPKQSWHDHKNDAEGGQHFDTKRSKVLKHPDGSNPGDLWSISVSRDPFFGRAGIPPQRQWPAWPNELCTIPILATTNPGDTVLDPFCGSGSLGVAAKLLGRKSVLVDIDPDSCRIAAVRVKRAQSPLIQGTAVPLL